MLVLWSPPASATDLPRIDHTIAKEPTYQSKAKYCLLMFGPEGKTRIWLALDPEARLLYVDCNSNGDLTEKGKRFEPPDRKDRLKNIDMRVFQIGEIFGKNKKVKYTNLKVEHWGTEKGAEGFRVELRYHGGGKR
jgi:hypothetical protein